MMSQSAVRSDGSVLPDPAGDDGALDGVTVLDLSDHPSGMIAARVFADWGADVARADPKDGPLRHPARTFRLVPDAELQDTMTTMLTAGMRVLPEQPVDFAEIDSADVVLTGSRPEAERILARNPRAVVVAVTDFPASGRYSAWVGSEMIHQALSGAMYTTGPADRPPLYGLGHRAYYATGWTVVIGAMGALLGRDRIARGQIVEISVYESCAAMAQNLVSQYAYSGTWPTRRRYDGMVTTIRCKDGWMVLFAYLHWPAICRAFEVMHLIDDPRFIDIEGRSENWDELSRLLQDAAVDLEVDRIVEIAQAGKAAASRANTMADIVGDPYHRDRLWVKRDDDSDGAIRVLRSGFHIGPLAPAAEPTDAEGDRR